MKSPLLLLLLLLLLPSIAFGSIYSYPDTKRPAISLRDACLIAEAMLREHGNEGRYSITEVVLCGEKAQSGWGAWNLWHYDKRGNRVNAYIPFPKGRCSLSYYPREHRTKGGEREAKFQRDGLTVKPLQ
jgi:hypothetical protein